MKLTHILFDLDNTLYPASTGIFPEIARRMTAFVAEFFSCDTTRAETIRREYARRFGTTLGGLLAVGGLQDPELFLERVHPENVADYIPKNAALGKMLAALPYSKAVLTNSPREHAERVLERLEIRSFFPHVFD
ncbi:MAG TPA: pyrimidine 5'-nucleotidase, partial [Spirochaetia bacterium]|nr:pyrimidine 5'-nucleotidase [Spirochaetia bacterium]